MPPEAPSRFKSSFSTFSLLPSRRSPLIISHPMPPTQPVSHHPTIISNTISPVHSQYPSPSTPPPSLREKERRTPSPRRPPPLDLNKTKALYPSAPAENSPDVNVLPVREKAAKPRTVVDDPFDVAEVEPGHRYTSWKGGKVGIKPGQVIPRSLLRVPSEMPITRLKTEPESPDQYDSVLYNVLLTPTYLGHSPLPVPSSSPSPLASSSNPKRRSLIDRATDTIHHVARMSRHPGWVGKGILKHRDEEVGRSVREMREREQREMERFRNATRMGRLGSGALVAGRSYSPLPEISCAYPRRSPGQREWRVGGALGLSCTAPNDESGKKVEREWRVMKKEEDRIKRRQRIWKYLIALIILCLAALTIGLWTSLLTRSSGSNSTPSDASSSSNTSGSPSSSASSSAPSATSTSQSLTACLKQFTTSAPTAPLSFPCSDCTPVLKTATNDFSTPLVNGDSTDVGAALQFCALMDLYRATGNTTGLSAARWAKDSSPCDGWSGISCDSRGRITGLQMQSPNVPDRLPTTLSDLVALQSLHITGNSTIPMGEFPAALLSMPDLETLDIEYTSLTGPLSTVDFGRATGLKTLYLVNNQELGTSLPSLSGNSKLVTLGVTGQGLTNVTESKLPNSLTYLDLSFNSLSDTVPSFTSLTSLGTLYLQNNAFSRAPSSLPTSLSTLSLTSNPNLAGNMPSAVCSSAALTGCDLRSTQLSGINVTTPIMTLANATTSVGKVCGVCRFS